MEEFLHNNSVFLVLAIALIIWAGIAVYIFAVDKKLTKLEKDFDTIKNTKDKL